MSDNNKPFVEKDPNTKIYDDQDVEDTMRLLLKMDFHYEKTKNKTGFPIKTIKKWHRQYGGKYLGEKNISVYSASKNYQKEVEQPLTPKKKSLQATLKEAEKLSKVPSAEELKAVNSIAECNEQVIRKTTKLKLAALERLEDLIEVLSSENLIRTVEVLNKVDTEPRKQEEERANSFMQLIQKQVIYQNVKKEAYEHDVQSESESGS